MHEGVSQPVLHVIYGQQMVYSNFFADIVIFNLVQRGNGT